MAAVRLGRIPPHLREKIVRLVNEGKSQREVHRHRTEKKLFCRPATCVPVNNCKNKHVALRRCRRTAR